LGLGFAVVAARAIDISRVPAQTLRDLTALGTQWLHDPALQTWLNGLDAQLVLLRPDRYVFATAQTTDEMKHWNLSLTLTQTHPQSPDTHTKPITLQESTA
jgi:hypothetical protein